MEMLNAMGMDRKAKLAVQAMIIANIEMDVFKIGIAFFAQNDFVIAFSNCIS